MATKKKATIEQPAPEVTEEIEGTDELARRKVILKLKHVDVKFNVRGRKLNAIRDANLEIFEGETLAIVGESGSGKSVLTKTFAGMLDANGFISHGNVYFSDDSLSQTRVFMNSKNRSLHRKMVSLLNEYSLEECCSEQYLEIQRLTKEEKAASELPLDRIEEFETREKKLIDDTNDNTNALMAVARGKENAQKRAQLKSFARELRQQKKQLELDRKAAHREARQAFRADTAAREAFRTRIAELSAIRAKAIAEARQKGLSPEVLARNERIADEIVLSLGRYPVHLQWKYSRQLLAGYHEYMRMGKDLFTEKQNRRVFEPCVFRVEYRNRGTIESHPLKAWIEDSFSKSIAKPVVDDEILSNESLIEQAYGLHPHLRKSLYRRIGAIVANSGMEEEQQNAQKIADLILLKVADFNSTIHAWIWANKLVHYVSLVYASKKTNFESDIKPRPMEVLDGYAHIDCAKVRYLKDWEKIRGCRIATVFQDPMTSLDPIIPIGKQIMIVIQKHQHCSTFEAKRRALSIMAKVGIPEPEKRFDDYPFQYSGGMRQRIVIAIALSCQPKILICDEPTTALDVTIQAQIIRLIKKLSKDLGFTTVYITHDLGVVANVAERVAVLYGGQIIELGTVEDIFYDPRHPYTWALLSSLPQLARSGEDLFSINGTPPSLYNKIVGDAFAPRNQYAMAIDFVKEPPMFQVNEHHWAKTWLLDPRAPHVEKPALIQNLHERMAAIYVKEGNE